MINLYELYKKVEDEYPNLRIKLTVDNNYSDSAQILLRVDFLLNKEIVANNAYIQIEQLKKLTVNEMFSFVCTQIDRLVKEQFDKNCA